MSDYGDFCREQRERKQKMRRSWVECPTCAVAYGTGTKVPPGEQCRNCGWTAPKSAVVQKRKGRRRP